jgi:hypothetical protein
MEEQDKDAETGGVSSWLILVLLLAATALLAYIVLWKEHNDDEDEEHDKKAVSRTCAPCANAKDKSSIHPYTNTKTNTTRMQKAFKVQQETPKITLSNITTSGVTVTVTGDGLAEQFTLQWALYSEKVPEWDTINLTPVKANFATTTLLSLRAATQYIFRARALRYEADPSEFATASFETLVMLPTPESAPNNPTNVQIKSATPDSLTWSFVSQSSTASYQVQWILASEVLPGRTATWSQFTLPPVDLKSTGTVTLTRLTANTMYYMRIRAIVLGAASTNFLPINTGFTSSLDTQAPGAPTIAIQSATSVSTRMSVETAGAVPATAYRTYIAPLRSLTTWTASDHPVESSLDVATESPGTAYAVRTLSVAGASAGTSTTVVAATPAEQPIGTALLAPELSVKGTTLTITSSTTGRPTHAAVEESVDGTTWTWTAVELTDTSTTFTINAKTWYVRVRLVSETTRVAGPASTMTIQIAPPAAGTVRSAMTVVATAATETTLTLTCTCAAGATTAFLSCGIAGSTVMSEATSSITQNGLGVFTVTVTGLVTDTPYDILIAAQYADGGYSVGTLRASTANGLFAV